MNTKTSAAMVGSLLFAAFAGCTLFIGSAQAQDHTVTIAIKVSTKGLDVRQRKGAQMLYGRLRDAAWVACTHGNRVDLAPASDLEGCRENALAGAIRAAHLALLTQVYLASHGVREAAAHGIDAPLKVAAQ